MKLTLTIPPRIAARLRALAEEHDTPAESLAADAISLLVGSAPRRKRLVNERTNERTNERKRRTVGPGTSPTPASSNDDDETEWSVSRWLDQ